MKQAITACLLCGNTLQPVRSWWQLLSNQLAPTLCEACYSNFEPAQTDALFTYNEAMKAWLNQYKILGDVQLAHSFRTELARALKTTAIMVPIPVHPAKLERRTFAQVDMLLDCAGIRYTHYLCKVEDSTQGLRNRAERLASANPFTLAPNKSATGKHFIVFDDIKTTGTTLSQACEVLQQAGAASVKTFTLSASEL